MSKKLYQAIKATVEEIEAKDTEGFSAMCARRKLNAISERSSLKVLVQVGRDLELIASKMTAE